MSMGKTKFFTNAGRVLLSLAFLSILGAWWTQLTGADLLGLSQQHLFNDAMALSLLGIGSLVDSRIHKEAGE